MSKKDDAYDLRRIFEEIERNLAASLKRTMRLHELEEDKHGFKWEQWQSAKLRNLAAYRKENKAIVEEQSKPIEDMVNKSLEDSYKRGGNVFGRFVGKVQSWFKRRKPMKYPKDVSDYKGKGTPREDDFFHINDKKIEALQETVNHDLKKAQTGVLRKMDDVYRQTIYKAEMHMTAGAKTLDQAIDMATKEFLEKGINCIEYKNGRRVNIASYAEMALRTASHRATLLGEGKKRDEWGIHTVVVSAHANTCPKCAMWQGEILIDDVFSSGTMEEALEGKYYLLSIVIEAGLLHPNCRHTLSTYFPGITQLPSIPDGKEAVKKYEAEREQRKLEQLIRKWKRIAEGSQHPDNVNHANNKVGEYQKQLREHLDKHPYLRRDYSREKIRGVTSNNYAGSVSKNTGTPVSYNSENDYSIKLDGYSEVVNDGLSEASHEVAALGGKDGYEHLQLVNLENGDLSYYETNHDPGSVGGREFWDFRKKNADSNFAFVHNHNTDGSLSEADLRTLLTTKNIPVMIAVRNDSVKYVAEREGSTLESGWFDDLYEKEITELNKLCRNGIISADERSRKRELLIVENLLRDYTKGKGLIEFDGRKNK